MFLPLPRVLAFLLSEPTQQLCSSVVPSAASFFFFLKFESSFLSSSRQLETQCRKSAWHQSWDSPLHYCFFQNRASRTKYVCVSCVRVCVCMRACVQLYVCVWGRSVIVCWGRGAPLHSAFCLVCVIVLLGERTTRGCKRSVCYALTYGVLGRKKGGVLLLFLTRRTITILWWFGVFYGGGGGGGGYRGRKEEEGG